MNKEKLIELIKTDIETVLKPKLEEQIKESMKIASVVIQKINRILKSI